MAPPAYYEATSWHMNCLYACITIEWDVHMKAAFFALTLLAASMNANATTIDTAAQTGSDFRCLGISSGCGQTFGQVFTVATADTYLSSFSLFPTAVSGGALTVQMSIYAWSGNNKTGSVLFQSGAFTLPNNSTTALNYTPNVNLTQGMQYIAFLNTAGLGNTSSASAGFTVFSDAYAGGNFMWERTAGNGVWNGTPYDTRFTARHIRRAEPRTIDILMKKIVLMLMLSLSWAGMAPPARAETIKPVKTGPNSRVIPKATVGPTKFTALTNLNPK